jgi:hypothetical protein
MASITSRDAAVRLARAIASDLLLYNDAALRAGKDLSGEIAEGRELFHQRVDASLHDVYEATIAQMLPGTARAPASAGSTVRAAREPAQRPPPPYAVQGDAGGGTRGSRALPIVVAALAIAAVVFVLLFVRW